MNKIEKLQPVHLASFIPFELKIRVFRTGQSLFVEDLTLNGEILDYIFEDSSNVNNEYKPILYPLPCLVKEITHNGRTFVPIVELLNINQYLSLKTLKIIKVWHQKYEENDLNFSCVNFKKNRDKKVYSFAYSEGFSRFINRIETDHRPLATGRQLQMFQKLFEWGFNVFGLPEHLFVDKSTI